MSYTDMLREVAEANGETLSSLTNITRNTGMNASSGSSGGSSGGGSGSSSGGSSGSGGSSSGGSGGTSGSGGSSGLGSSTGFSTISTTSNNLSYTGGNQVISSYTSGRKIIFNATYAGATFDGAGNFVVNSNLGVLAVQNADDKVIDLSTADGTTFLTAYETTNPAVIDGRNYAGYEIINGSAAGSDFIYAGNGGSQLWGGAGFGADVLTGGGGADIFIGGRTQGADVFLNASSADAVYLNDATLSDIVAASEANGVISLAFNTGNAIAIQSSELLSAAVVLADGLAYRFNHVTKSWQNA